MIPVGIDLGKNGALVRITDVTLEAIVMPLIGKEIDAFAILQWLKEQRPDMVILEKVVFAGTANDKNAAISHVSLKYPDLELVPPR